MSRRERPVSDDTKERRLDDIRAAAARGELVTRRPSWPEGLLDPVASPETGYYGQPLLKEPTWTREIPAYFFVGGVAGGCSIIGAIAAVTGRADRRLARDARWIAVGGAAVSAVLLISDLGRPARFLHMLRVFKRQSPMSVGVWTLMTYSGAAAAAAGLAWIEGRGSVHAGVGRAVRGLGRTMDVTAALVGSALATYTGVLIGVSAVPVWAANVKILPFEFGVSALGSAGGVLELLGHRHVALDRLGVIASLANTAAVLQVELRDDVAMEPLHHGVGGLLTRAGGVLSGPASLLLRAAASRPAWRTAAALAAVAGALLLKTGWYRAGFASARDPRPPLDLRAPDGKASAEQPG